MDKWLWAARFFKTRSLAARACELERITSNELPAKASREVRVGDKLKVKNDSGEFEIEVLILLAMTALFMLLARRALRVLETLARREGRLTVRWQ